MRVTSWLPTNVAGSWPAESCTWRVSAQSSSKKLRSTRLLQIAFQSSYCVIESMPEAAANAA
jgi:hypothetical protein